MREKQQASETGLIVYSAACRAIAEAKAIDEVKDIRDKAEAMRAYAHQAKNKGLEIDAAEIRMRAERRLGEIIKLQWETEGKASGRPKNSAATELISKPTLAAAGIDRKLSSRAQKLAAVPENEFENMVGEWRDRIEHENERVTVSLLRQGERAQRDEELAKTPTVWPNGKYPVIYADPPWRYEHPPMGDTGRSIENHYPTMTLEEICALPVPTIATEDSIIYLWATAPKLSECMEVLKSWGFDYRTCIVWIKDKIGMGYYARNQHELLLIGRRGKMPPPPPEARVSSVISAPRTEHSSKPEEFYEHIEAMYPEMPKIELFARQPRPAWDAWGNQAGSGDGEDA